MGLVVTNERLVLVAELLITGPQRLWQTSKKYLFDNLQIIEDLFQIQSPWVVSLKKY